MTLKHDNQNSGEHPKQLFYVWNYLEWGGVQTYFLGLMRCAARFYRVKVVLPSGSDEKILRYLEENNIEYDFFDGRIDLRRMRSVGQKIKRRFSNWYANYILAQHLTKYNLSAGIVQIDVAPWAGFALLLFLVLKTNVFLTLHTAVPAGGRLRNTLLKIKFAVLCRFKTFHLHASNLDVKKSLRPLVGESRYRQIEIIYSSINAAEIEKAIAKVVTKRKCAERYDFPADKIWVCSVGQFIERKGCWILIEAVEILRKERQDLFFCWLGTAALGQEISEKIEKYDLGRNFRFLSAAEIGAQRSDLLTLWNAAEIFALPSFQEGLPMALIEAMALGKACVASDVNAIPEAVTHLETGWLVEAGDARQLAQAISDLADDAVLRKRLGENARTAVLENFEEKITGEKMLGLYEAAN